MKYALKRDFTPNFLIYIYIYIHLYFRLHEFVIDSDTIRFSRQSIEDGSFYNSPVMQDCFTVIAAVILDFAT